MLSFSPVLPHVRRDTLKYAAIIRRVSRQSQYDGGEGEETSFARYCATKTMGERAWLLRRDFHSIDRYEHRWLVLRMLTIASSLRCRSLLRLLDFSEVGSFNQSRRVSRHRRRKRCKHSDQTTLQLRTMAIRGQRRTTMRRLLRVAQSSSPPRPSLYHHHLSQRCRR